MKKKENKEEKNKKENKIKWLYIILPIILIVIVLIFILGYFYLKTIDSPKILKLSSVNLHEIEMSWEYKKDYLDYKIIMSLHDFDRDDILPNLQKGNLGSEYKVTNVHGNDKVILNGLLSDTDYYFAVIAIHDVSGKKKYSNLSDTKKIHTKKLDVKEVINFTSDNVTDKSVKLKWESIVPSEKNLDGSNIEITYTLYLINPESQKKEEISKNIKENEYAVEKLDAHTLYHFSIAAEALVDGKTVKGIEGSAIEVLTKLEPVSNLAAKSAGISSITLSWDKYDKVNIENENSSITYSVYASDDKSDNFKLLAEGIEDNTYTENNLSDNKTRYYYVVAFLSEDEENYDSIKSQIVSATTDKKYVPPSTGSSGGTSGGSTSGGGSSTNWKGEEARKVAREIAKSITGTTDLEKVTKAAIAVSEYYQRGVHKETGNDYYTAYGVFIKGESSCAGTTRALGMVLEEMGYTWKHANENQWTHQWVIINMDGQIGWADGQIGMAGYGKHPIEG